MRMYLSLSLYIYICIEREIYTYTYSTWPRHAADKQPHIHKVGASQAHVSLSLVSLVSSLIIIISSSIIIP